MGYRALGVAGAVLWIIGLAMAITGLNIKTETGTWMTVAGNIIFLVGLFLEGIFWFRKKKEEEKNEKSGEPNNSQRSA